MNYHFAQGNNFKCFTKFPAGNEKKFPHLKYKIRLKAKAHVNELPFPLKRLK